MTDYYAYIPGWPGNKNVNWAAWIRPDALADRHTEGINVCFVDGHLKWMRAENMVPNQKAWIPVLQN